ncbi:MAG: hypothetical protein AAGP08_16600, partial [Pseudomonadota bacterium]
MTMLKDFSSAFDASGLSQVILIAGRTVPFCAVDWRSLHPEADTQPADATWRTFGVRSLALAQDDIDYGVTDDGATRRKARVPEAVRVLARPRNRGGQNKLRIWSPITGSIVDATFLEREALSDVLAVPEPNWKTQQQFVVNHAPMRLADGRLEGDIHLAESTADFRRLLNKDAPNLTGIAGFMGAFQAFKLSLKPDPQGNDDRAWPITVSPSGIEFDARVLDPTRGKEEITIEEDKRTRVHARFRLEATGQGEDGGFLVRLIGVAHDDADNSARSLRDMTGRLTAMLDQAGQDNAPAVFRFDARNNLPRLVWPLTMRSGGLSVELGRGGDPLVLIEPEGINLRLATQSPHRSARSGLASIHGQSFELHWLGNQIELDVAAGTREVAGSILTYRRPPSDENEKEPEFALDFSRIDLDHRPVDIPLAPLFDRLGEAYRQSNALLPSDPPPFAFFALEEGWLQWPLPLGSETDAASDETEEDVADTTPPPSGSAMTGRIVAVAEDDIFKAARGLVVDDANGVDVRLKWDFEAGWVLREVTLTLYGDTGRFLGFLFAADTGPTANEALPGWQFGDASVVEVPIWYGTKPRGASQMAKFTWIGGLAQWHIDMDPGET